MRLSFASLLRRLAGLIHPDVAAPLTRLGQSLLFLQHEMSQRDFRSQITQDIIEGSAPFRRHLGQLESALQHFIDMKAKIAPEMEGKQELLEETEKLAKKVLDDVEELINQDLSDDDFKKQLDIVQKVTDELSEKIRAIAAVVVPKLERTPEHELETFKTRSEKPAPQKSLIKKLFRRNAMRESLTDVIRTAAFQLQATSMATVATPQQFPEAAEDFIDWLQSIGRTLKDPDLLKRAPHQLFNAVERSLSMYIKIFPKMSQLIKPLISPEKMEKAKAGLSEIEGIIETAQKGDADYPALAQQAEKTLHSVAVLVHQTAKDVENKLRTV